MNEQMSTTYNEATAYIDEIPKFTKKHPLEHTREFLRRLGNPAMDRKIIHVAGTNGKGSVCAYLQAILMAEGHRTGFFTSPHLVKVNERIQFDRTMISDEEFLRVFLIVRTAAGQMEEEGLGHPSYFEFLFGMGMLAFDASDVEYIILETGLGGRLDATNSVPEPVLTIITSLSLDHTAILGDTIEQVAYEKAGIIKEGVPVFCDGTSAAGTKVIRATAESRHAPLTVVTEDSCDLLEVRRKYIAFSRRNAYDKSVIYRVPICGFYQVMNAEIALEAAEYLLGKDAKAQKIMKEAVEQVRWEGRMELLSDHMVLDGAHNPGAVDAFIRNIRLLKEAGVEKAPAVLVFSAVSDKKYEQMIADLCANLDLESVVVTKIEDSRGVQAEELAKIFRKYAGCPVYQENIPGDALKKAENLRTEDGMIYCLGSLYLAGMIKKLICTEEQK